MTDNISLPFSMPRQAAVFHHLLHDKQFSLRFSGLIKASWFNNVCVQRLWYYALAWRKDLGRFPTGPEMAERVFFIELPPEAKTLADQIPIAALAAQKYGADLLWKDIMEWSRARIFREACATSEREFNTRHFDKAYDIIKEAGRALQEVERDPSLDFDFRNLPQVLAESEGDFADALTTGARAFDDALLPRSVGDHREPRKSERAGHDLFLLRRVAVASFASAASRLR